MTKKEKKTEEKLDWCWLAYTYTPPRYHGVRLGEEYTVFHYSRSSRNPVQTRVRQGDIGIGFRAEHMWDSYWYIVWLNDIATDHVKKILSQKRYILKSHLTMVHCRYTRELFPKKEEEKIVRKKITKTASDTIVLDF